MRSGFSPQPQSASIGLRRDRGFRNFVYRLARRFPVLPITVLAFFALPALLSGQTPAEETAAPAPHVKQKPVHAHKHSTSAALAAAPTPEPPAPAAPPEPEKPKWPAFEQPSQATVTWDSRGLTIEATNSSLLQILKDFSAATGAKVEGLATDQRVFGEYGPGQARDVLAQLLQGSGYDILMVGDQGQGAPREILFSARQSGGAQNTARGNMPSNDEEEEEQPAVQEPEPQQPPPRPAFPPGMPPRSPQIMQELQERQRQMQQNQPQLPQQNQPQ